MYHRIVARKVRSTFAQISVGKWDPMLDGMAPEFSYRFYGEHALSGERQTLDALRRWWERSARLFPNPTGPVHRDAAADHQLDSPRLAHARTGRSPGPGQAAQSTH
jgi:ketosteroid isomerase-like protein